MDLNYKSSRKWIKPSRKLIDWFIICREHAFWRPVGFTKMCYNWMVFLSKIKKFKKIYGKMRQKKNVWVFSTGFITFLAHINFSLVGSKNLYFLDKFILEFYTIPYLLPRVSVVSESFGGNSIISNSHRINSNIFPSRNYFLN